MALTYFESKESLGSGIRPFLNVYLQENPTPEETAFEVVEICDTRSGGILVSSEYFSLYYDQRSKVRNLLIQALQAYTTPDQKGYGLFIVVASKTKNKGVVAADFDQFRIWTEIEKGKYVVGIDDYGDAILPTTGFNPFLPPVPSTQTTHYVAEPTPQRNKRSVNGKTSSGS